MITDFERWCGEQGLTKPDEIALAAHILNGGSRSDTAMNAISHRWLALFTKWEAKGWWEYGVSLRLGWFSDVGEVGITARIKETNRRLGMNEEREVELQNTAPTCVDAARNTIRMIGGELIERDGRYFLVGKEKPTKFVVWAAVHQGYVKREITTPKAEVTETPEGTGDKPVLTLLKGGKPENKPEETTRQFYPKLPEF